MLTAGERWLGRARTLRAMLLLCSARVLVEWVPFDRWRNSLGLDEGRDDALEEAARCAAVVERAAARLPFSTKCLSRAIALSWLLRRHHIAHAVVFAASPVAKRQTADALHAWVEIARVKVIGDLPGPWLEMLCLGQAAGASNLRRPR